MPSVLCKAQIGAGTPASGAVTVAQGDVITLSLASTSGLQTFLWEIYSHPVDDSPLAAGYDFPCPSGWTTDPDGYTYTYSGAAPPTLTIPSGAYWGKILIRCTCNGDATLRDETLMLRLDSPAGVEDAAPFETNQADSVRSYSRAIQKFLRMFSTSVGDVQTSFVWDTTQASSAAVGRYATFAEIVAAIGSTDSPVTVQLIGAPTTSGTATYEWDNVTFTGNDDTTTLTGTEGVVIRNAKFVGPFAITSTATTTKFLTYTAGKVAYFEGPELTGSATEGLITSNVAGPVTMRLGGGTIVGDNAIESTVATEWKVYTDEVTWSGTQQFIGSTGSIEYFATPNTYGVIGFDSYTGTYTNSTVLPVAPSSSDLAADDLIYFPLTDAAGTTSIANAGNGTAFTLGTLTGTVAFESATPTGDGMFVVNTAYFTGTGSALTYQPTTNDLTIHCWVKFMKQTTLGAGGEKVLLFGKESPTGASFALAVAQDDGKLQAYIDTSSGGPATYEGGFVDTGWNHIAMTYDGGNVIGYINGNEVLNNAKTGTIVYDNTKSFVVGNNADNGLVTVKDIIFVNTYRTKEELKAIYKRGAYGTSYGT